MEDSGLEQMTEEITQDGQDMPSKDVFAEDAIYDQPSNMEQFTDGGVIRTFDGEIAGDEFAQDAMNYQILLGKIDSLLDGLKLDA